MGSAIGRPLSPEFERKCLSCHGAPKTPRGETGVRCESCHGPGSEHIKAVASKAAALAITNPGKLSNEAQLNLCGECHSGFSDIQDPVPGDLLISSQSTALRKTQCYVQSGAGLACTSCHDPHHDASGDQAKTVAACRGCHDPHSETHAALCPVNKNGACIECHMPEVRKGSFQITDHWIRVHPEQGIHAARRDPSDRTRVVPKRLTVRWIVATDREKAEAARRELAAGTTFFSVAQKYSTDPSAIAGGFLGDLAVKDMNPALAQAALKIGPGEFSPVIEANGKPVIVYRMPRDFLDDAGRLYVEATDLRKEHKLAEASRKYLESLEIYPYFLRALIFLGVSSGEQGDGGRALSVLSLAAQFYPEDPAAQYNLGIAYGVAGRTDDEIRAYRRAIKLEPTLIPAYINLGSTIYAAARLDEATRVFRQGLDQNPLAATLYYDLSMVYRQQGKLDEAARAAALAAKIDPKFAATPPQAAIGKLTEAVSDKQHAHQLR